MTDAKARAAKIVGGAHYAESNDLMRDIAEALTEAEEAARTSERESIIHRLETAHPQESIDGLIMSIRSRGPATPAQTCTHEPPTDFLGCQECDPPREPAPDALLEAVGKVVTLKEIAVRSCSIGGEFMFNALNMLSDGIDALAASAVAARKPSL